MGPRKKPRAAREIGDIARVVAMLHSEMTPGMLAT
jgi:hypothetical protein